jgi:hypothetical protein
MGKNAMEWAKEGLEECSSERQTSFQKIIQYIKEIDTSKEKSFKEKKEGVLDKPKPSSLDIEKQKDHSTKIQEILEQKKSKQPSSLKDITTTESIAKEAEKDSSAQTTFVDIYINNKVKQVHGKTIE